MRTERILDDDFWKENLSPIQYKVTRQGGTEAPFSENTTWRIDKDTTNASAVARNCSLQK